MNFDAKLKFIFVKNFDIFWSWNFKM